MPGADAAPPPSTLDALLDGRLRLHQPATGHRAGSDAVLLAAAAPDGFAGHAVDLGCGVGTVGLALAVRCPQARVTLVDDDPRITAFARRNVAENGLDARVDVMDADAFDRSSLAALCGRADLVLTNPPFLYAASARTSHNALRQKAHVMPSPGLSGWIAGAAECLRAGGTLLIIHRADALPDLLVACRKRFGGLTVIPLQPADDRPARRVILRAKEGSGAPFVLAPSLVLHRSGRFTAEAAALHDGRGCIEWPDAVIGQ